MRFTKLWFLVLALALFTLPAVARTSAMGDDESSCSHLLIGHRYAFVFQGFVDLGDGKGLTPNVGGGVIHFGRDGRFSSVAKLNIGGVPGTDSLQGNYSMTEDHNTQPPVCAGTVRADDGTTLQFLVSRNGEVLEQMHTDQGLIVVVTSLPMEAGPCTDFSLRGTYLYSANGFFATISGLLQPFGSYTPFAFSGAISFDGRGHLTGWDTVSLGGSIAPRTYSGTYHVNPDCSATSEFIDSMGHDLHTINYLYEGGRAIAVVNIDAGTLLAFNAIRE